jgi:hypothetical protein
MKNWQIGVSVALSLIVGLGIGAGISFIAVNNTKKEEPKSVTIKESDKSTVSNDLEVTNVTNPRLTVAQDSAGTTVTPVEKWTGEITLSPKNANKFKKIVTPKLKDYECGIYGQVTYNATPDSDNNFVKLMKIYNINLPGIEKGIPSDTTYAKAYLSGVPALLNNKVDQEYVDSFYYLNNQTCNRELEFPSLVVIDPYKINSIEYDTALVYASEQSVSILAKKGDNYVILSDGLSNNFINKDCTEKFSTNLPGISTEARKCLRQYYSQNSEYKSLVDDKVQELLTIFAL